MIRINNAVNFTFIDPETGLPTQGKGFVSAHLSENEYEITSPAFGVLRVPVDAVEKADIEIEVKE